jgi:hypothetical protein
VSLTKEERTERVATSVAARDPNQLETLRLPWRTGFGVFPVVEIELEALVLNPRSHRIQAQLESDPHGELVRRDPWSDESQAVIAQILRTMENFQELARNLDAEGQQQPGVITASGLLVNANRRAVALRDNHATHIRVAVLSHDAQDPEIDRLEFSLQLQRDFREEYTFTNRLLFVNELIGTQGWTIDEVARALYIAAGTNPSDVLKKAKARVDRDTRVLTMIRRIQERSGSRLPLTRFDDQEIAFEELDAKLEDVGQDTATGRGLYEIRLLGLLTDLPYRDLRKLDADVVDDFVLPLIRGNPVLGDLVEHLPTEAAAGDPIDEVTGLDLLEDEAAAPPTAGTVGALNDLLARSHGEEVIIVEAADGPRRLDRQPVVEAVYSSLRAAVQEMEAQGRTDDQLRAPANRLAEAERKVQFAREAYQAVAAESGFDKPAFLVALKRLEQRVAELGDAADGHPTA